jgi:endonuclease I
VLRPCQNSILSAVGASALAAALLALASGPVLADPPPGYYDSLDYSSPEAFRNSLHDIIDAHIKIPYTASSTDTWNVLELADQDPNNSGRIIDVYKNTSYIKHGAGNDDYNREHTWPKSYGFPIDGSSNMPYSDCHMLMLCDVTYNSARSNNIYDDCTSSCYSYPAANYNGEYGVNYRNWDVWETWIGRRGDVARAQFYADIRYSGDISYEPDLILTDDTSLIVAVSQNADVAYMGVMQTLIQWHYDDPVDERERRRNDMVYIYQRNRNPFIDHPEFVAMIFEDVSATGEGVPQAGPVATIASIYPNPFNPTTTIDFSLTRSGPVRVEIFSVDGKLVRTLLSEDRQAGDHQVRWDGVGNMGSPVPSGAYFCRILGSGPGEGDTQPLLLLK